MAVLKSQNTTSSETFRANSAAMAEAMRIVEEAAALAAAGPGGELVQPRIATARVTCALARSPA